MKFRQQAEIDSFLPPGLRYY